MMNYYNGMWFFGFVMWILVVIALVLLIFYLAKQIQKPNKK